LINDECTSSRCEAGKVLSGREDAKFHSSSVATPLRAGAPAGDDVSAARSSKEDEGRVGLVGGCLLNGEDDLELGVTSAAKGSAGA
jgi:hypothetical protein